MNAKAPQILNDIVEALKKSNLKAVNENAEGRVNSKKDEDKIIVWLQKQPKFNGRIKEGVLRSFMDMEVEDYDGTTHAVNIKTSVGSSDNAFSKLGLLWALTDLTAANYTKFKISNKISDTKFAELVIKHKKETARDYWFLSLDKKNFSHVMVRGVKQITHWGKNPTNNLQIMWGKEHECGPGSDTFENVFYNVITNGAFKCWADKADQWAKAIEFRNTNLKKTNNLDSLSETE
jgi:hypothetical protein